MTASEPPVREPLDSQRQPSGTLLERAIDALCLDEMGSPQASNEVRFVSISLRALEVGPGLASLQLDPATAALAMETADPSSASALAAGSSTTTTAPP